MFRLDNVVKVVANSGVTVIVSLAVYLIFGLFPFSPLHFVIGTFILLGGSYMYAKETAKDRLAYAPLDGEGNSQKSYFSDSSTRVKLLALVLLAATAFIFSVPPVQNPPVVPSNPPVHNEPAVPSDPPEQQAPVVPSDPLAPIDAIDIDARLFRSKPLVIVSYASSINMMFCRTFRSMLASGLTVFIVGHLQSSEKTRKPFKYLNVSKKAQFLDEDQIIGFLDGYDIFAQQDESYIVNQVNAIGSKIIYSAEKNCWPFVLDPNATEELCPRYSPNEEIAGLYAPGKDVRWPNSGIMFCKAKSCQRFFEDSIHVKPKWYEHDDQAIAQESCLLWGEDCKLDLFSRLAQSMYWSKDDVIEVDNHWVNNVTKTKPAFIHFNGDKSEFIPMDRHGYLKPGDLDGRWIHFENGTKSTLKDVCSEHLGPEHVG